MISEALIVSAILFVIGVVGVLTRRNAIILFMCAELMLNAVNLSFVALAKLHNVTGHVFVVMVMTTLPFALPTVVYVTPEAAI